METNRDRVEEYTKKHAGAVTNYGATALPDSASKRPVVHRIEGGGAVAGSLQINDSDGTAIDGLYLEWPAGGRSHLELSEVPMTKGRGIRYTTTGAGANSVMIRYSWRDEP